MAAIGRFIVIQGVAVITSEAILRGYKKIRTKIKR